MPLPRVGWMRQLRIIDPLSKYVMPIAKEQEKTNLRMALVLASVAAAFLIGFITKMALLGH